MTTPANPLAVRISPPAVDMVPGRGFYQLEERALYVPIGTGAKGRHYFSSLESVHARLDIDREGRLMFVEVTLSRSNWRVADRLPSPVWAPPADVRWLGFRTAIPNPTLLTNRSGQSLLIRFSPAPPVHTVAVADSVYVSVDARGAAVSLFVSDIIDDLAGREIARFRQMSPALP